jgi:hypothetical protein
MSKRLRFSILLAAGAMLAIPAQAAVLLTNDLGYAGPVITLTAADTSGYGDLLSPISGGSSTIAAIINDDGDGTPVVGTAALAGGYGLGANGSIQVQPILGSNSFANAISITFDTAVASFGGDFNYAPIDGLSAWISAYDENDALIASFDLPIDGAIATPGGFDSFAFRGIATEPGDALIKRFLFGGSYIALATYIAPDSGTGGSQGPGSGAGAVPEPASWAMLVTGFGLAGAALRRRERGVARSPR